MSVIRHLSAYHPALYARHFLFIVSVTLGVIYLSGCSAQRQVQNNNFTSTYPRISVAVDNEFHYLGKGTYDGLSESRSNPDGLRGKYSVEFHFFAPDKIEKQVMHKGIMVYFEKMHTPGWSWALPYFQDESKLVFDHEMRLLGGEYYEYAITFEQTKSDSKIGTWLNSKGYMLPGCRIKIYFVKREEDDLIKSVMYYEDIRMSEVGCKNWNDKSKLTDKQREFVSTVVSRSNKALKILPSKVE